MKKMYMMIIVCSIILTGCETRSELPEISSKKNPDKPQWKLIFEDQFNSTGNFDQSKWGYSTRGNAAWARYLTSSSEYAYQDGSNLVLKMDNKTIAQDNIPYHSAGIQTKGKFSFKYGKVEVRAKFKAGRGSWPAIWMMPETSVYGNWPGSGEIDIMEHVNKELHVHQTIHNATVTNPNGASSVTKTTPYNTDDYNTYSILWTANDIQFYVNNTHQYTYTRIAGADSKSWPFVAVAQLPHERIKSTVNSNVYCDFLI